MINNQRHIKKLSLVVIVAAVTINFSSCSKSSPEMQDPVDPISPVGSVETAPANSNYLPAFTGQTRIAAVKTTMAYGATVLTNGLTAPWGIAAMPDGRFLVTEKAGRMRVVSTTGAIGPALSGLPQVNSGGQGGLLGICLDPNFASNRLVYFSFSEPSSSGNQTAIGKGRLSGDASALEDFRVIYRAGPAYAGVNHYGGRVIFDPQGNLYVSSGERADLPTREQAQSLSSGLGKVARISPEGLALSGNPFAGQGGSIAAIFSYGHRNPQGLAIHPQTGELWQSEHGPRGGDEINRVQAGANYGWPVITYGLEYSGQPVGAAIQQRDGMIQPVYYWDPVVSPSGMTFYSGERLAEWRNNLFIATLSGMHVIRLVIENNRVTGEERLLSGEGQRFRDITQGVDGALYTITDQGRLYRIDRS